MGTIEVITGPMYAGKTSMLISKLVRAIYGKKNVKLFTKDERYDIATTHDGRKMNSCKVDDALAIMCCDLTDVHVVGIDEGQFFGPRLAYVCLKLQELGIERIMVAGLDLDSSERPFENMSELLSLADSVEKLNAGCFECGKPATRTFRKVNNTDRFLQGSNDYYEALCRRCFLDKNKKGGE